MKNKDEQLGEDTAHEILELAARYYTEQTNQEQAKGYTIDEMINAGTEAEIPDEYIQQAIARIEARNRKQSIELDYKNEFDQKARALAIDKGKADFIVTTLDRYLIYQPQGKIVGLIDRTVGADAVVFNNRAYPQLKSLLDLETLIEQRANQGKWLKIVYAKDTPSEFLATVLDTKFDNFKLANLEVVEVEDSSIAWERMQSDDDIALGILWEPFVTTAQSQGNTVALSSADAPKTIVDVIIASDRILANNPTAVTELVSTY